MSTLSLIRKEVAPLKFLQNFLLSKFLKFLLYKLRKGCLQSKWCATGFTFKSGNLGSFPKLAKLWIDWPGIWLKWELNPTYVHTRLGNIKLHCVFKKKYRQPFTFWSGCLNVPKTTLKSISCFGVIFDR